MAEAYLTSNPALSLDATQSADALRYEIAKESPIVELLVDSLLDSDSPRLNGEDHNHIRIMIESQSQLPPIIVHRQTMRVIDGMHRLRAAKLRGAKKIRAIFFDGDEASSFVLAVKANTLHGLPLSLADRKAAAIRIFTMYPEWSDRMVASAAGVAAKTVAKVRQNLANGGPVSEARVGRDGRVRPVDASQGREAAARVIAENPDASLREIALKAGISHETARNVRARLGNGQNPLNGESSRSSAEADRVQFGRPTAIRSVDDRGPSSKRIKSSLEALRNDPAFRSSEAGRTLLRMLATYRIIEQHGHRLVESLPDHCLGWVADAARECADAWRGFAEQLDQ